MSFSVRTAIAIAAFCATSLIGSGTPGLALEPIRPLIPTSFSVSDFINTAPPASVPQLPAPAVTVDQAAPSDNVDPVETDADDSSSRPTTLAALIATQDMPESIDSELACLAGAIYFESKGEPLAGQLAVGEVIMNRTKSGRFPTSACGVVTQRGQFSFVRAGRIPSVSRSNPAYRTAVAVAQVAMTNAWDSSASNALFFHARRVAPRWHLTRVAAIGGHIFYR